MADKVFPGLPVLIVDDEEPFLDSIKAQLRLNGFTDVETCCDSREVMPRLEKGKYSMVLLDISMPNVRGDELLPKIVEIYPHIPVIILTAYNDPRLVSKYKDKGAADLLVKTSDTENILTAIRSIIR